MPAPFAEFQPLENRLLPGCLRAAGVDWLLELAPAGSPEPQYPVPHHRLLLDDDGWCRPVKAPADQLPFEDESLPACLLRHLIQPGVPPTVFPDLLRCLQPGGLLIVVNPNPCHWQTWRRLGFSALRLPAWPVLQWMVTGHGLALREGSQPGWRNWVPGACAVLILVARKRAGARIVRPVKFRRPAVGSGTPATGHLRKSA